MKWNQKIKYFVLGAVMAIIFSALAMPAMGSMIQKQISVSTGVNIYVDDVKLNPVDSSGRPVDVFVYNGTTYLPVRAVADAVGKPVYWDGKTSSVYLGKHDSSEPSAMLKDLDYFNESKNNGRNIVVTGESFKDNFGNSYTDYVSYEKNNSSAWRDYKINGKYSSLKGTIVLNYDKRTTTNIGNFRVYGDNKLLYSSPSMTAGSDKVDFEVDVTGVLTLRIEFYRENKVRVADMEFAVVKAGLYQ